LKRRRYLFLKFISIADISHWTLRNQRFPAILDLMQNDREDRLQGGRHQRPATTGTMPANPHLKICLFEKVPRFEMNGGECDERRHALALDGHRHPTASLVPSPGCFGSETALKFRLKRCRYRFRTIRKARKPLPESQSSARSLTPVA
jgi:hypothetical protein